MNMPNIVFTFVVVMLLVSVFYLTGCAVVPANNACYDRYYDPYYSHRCDPAYWGNLSTGVGVYIR